MSGEICIYILSFLLLSGSVISDPQVKPASTPPQQDFGKGFAVLFQMGLPRLEGAQPALITIETAPVLTSYYGFDITNGQAIGWIKSPNINTEPATCIIKGVFECKLYNHSAMMEMQYEKHKNNSDNRQTNYVSLPEYVYFAGTWEIITTAKITEMIKESFPDKSQYGLLLLIAAQLYESGAKSEANEIAALLFKGRNHKEVLQAAINVLADALYLRAYCNFIESGNWKQFSADINKIIETFKDNWKAVPYAKAIHAAVATRIKNPEPPELKTLIPLSAQDRELLIQLSKMSQADYDNSYSNDFWLYPADKDDADMDKKKTSNVLDKIKNRGIKSIPLLIAMLEDEWFLPFRDKGGYYCRKENKEENNDDTKKQETSLSQAADYLVMPMMRRQLAGKLLEPLLLPEKNENVAYSERQDEKLKELCLTWYESIKNLDDKELRNKYLNNGTESQQAMVIKNMIAAVDDTTAVLIEKAVLESDMEVMNYDLLIRYCEIRKDKARPFIEKLRIKYYQHLTNGNKFSVDKEREKVNLDRLFEFLAPAKYGVSLEEVAREVLATDNDEDFEFIDRKFARAAKNQSPEKICQVVLNAAVQAKDARQKCFLLSLLLTPNKDKQKSKLDVAKFKSQFEKLLADQSAFSEEFSNRQEILLITTCILESMAGNIPDQADDSTMLELNRKLYDQWNEKYVQFLLRRAKSILDGSNAVKQPKLTDADELKDSQFSAAQKIIAGSNEDEIKKFCRLAQLEELIPLSVVLEKNEPFNQKLLPLANRIIAADTDLPEIKDQVAKFKGKVLDEQILQAIINLAENSTKNEQEIEVTLLRRSALQGVILIFNHQVNNKPDRINAPDHSKRLEVTLSFGGYRVNRTITPKNKNPDQALSEIDYVNSESFIKSQKQEEDFFINNFNTVFLKDGNALWSGKITISDKM